MYIFISPPPSRILVSLTHFTFLPNAGNSILIGFHLLKPDQQSPPHSHSPSHCPCCPCYPFPPPTSQQLPYRVTSLVRDRTTLGPYGRPYGPRTLCLGPYGGPRGGAFSYERATPEGRSFPSRPFPPPTSRTPNPSQPPTSQQDVCGVRGAGCGIRGL